MARSLGHTGTVYCRTRTYPVSVSVGMILQNTSTQIPHKVDFHRPLQLTPFPRTSGDGIRRMAKGNAHKHENRRVTNDVIILTAPKKTETISFELPEASAPAVRSASERYTYFLVLCFCPKTCICNMGTAWKVGITHHSLD